MPCTECRQSGIKGFESQHGLPRVLRSVHGTKQALVPATRCSYSVSSHRVRSRLPRRTRGTLHLMAGTKQALVFTTGCSYADWVSLPSM